MASVINEVDLIISLPKLKNHELVYLTGAIKNTLGLVPGFSKAKQHALHQDRESFSRFLVDLSEAVTPHFYLMDGIMGMEGPGPGQGMPVRTGVLIGSTNPLALDVTASRIAGYLPMDIPTNRIALSRGLWLKSFDEIEYNGPEIDSIIKTDFKRIHISPNGNISFRFLRNRLEFLRKLERRPVFNHLNCTGCRECIRICPQNAIAMHHSIRNHVVLTDRKCIRCFCCSEVCKHYAVDIKRKLIGI
jgi:ferredoxin